MDFLSQPAQVVAIVVAAVACVYDVRTRRIPNALTFGAALAALAFHAAAGGPAEVVRSASGWIVGLLLFFPFFALGGLGAGDVKLLAALGAWLGPGPILSIAIYSAMSGGVMALAIAVRAGYLKRAFQNIFGLLNFWAIAGLRPQPELTLERASAPRLAYAVPIFTGLIVTLWIR
jgi:prepilin peptidase CpaA